MVLIGLGLMVWGFAFPIGPASAAPVEGGVDYLTVAVIALAQRSAIFDGGGFVFAGGCAVAACGVLADTLRKAR